MDADERKLLDALRSQSPSALERLMDRYGNSIYGLIRRILAGIGQAEDIEECVSDVFLAAWKRIEQYDADKGSLKTWVLILAKYMALDVRRKLIKRPEMGELLDKMSNGESLEESVLTQEVLLEMTEMVNSLTEPDRTIFYRRYYYYETIEQIAMGLKLTNKAIENRLYRVRKLLKAMLDERRSEAYYG